METAVCWLLCAKVTVTTVQTNYEPVEARETIVKEDRVHREDAKPSRRKPNNRGQNNLADGWNVENSIRQHFGDEAEVAIQVAQCESGLRPDAVGYNTNGSYDTGVFQINSIHAKKIPSPNKKEWLMNPENNIKLAKQIYDRQSWSPWVCAKKLGIK